MNYPGLIDIGSRGGAGRIPFEVYEDVRLTALLDGEMIKSVMTQTCRVSDLQARQELFSALRANSDAAAMLRELYGAITSAKEYHERLTESRCSPERHLLFLHLSSQLLRFSSLAARMPKAGMLLSRFASFFENVVKEENFAALSHETETLLSQLSCFDEVSFRFLDEKEGGHLFLSKEKKETYLTRLQQCATILGIEGLDDRTSPTLHLSDELIEGIAQLHPECFAVLNAYYHRNFSSYEESILHYFDDIRFCLAIVDLCNRTTDAGIPLCYPKVSEKKEISLTDAYDITLLAKDTVDIVPNDAFFSAEFPFYYLTGANGGGKTTYLRTVAASVLLFLCGAPVPSRAASIYPLHQVFTHFPRDERFENNGRSADEERRMRAILQEADGDALILLNETYATTSEQTAITWTTTLADEIYGSGNFGVYVTHQHAVEAGKIPFLRVVVDRNDANRRTYKVERTHAEADSFARDVLAKYRLDGKSLTERFPKRK